MAVPTTTSATRGPKPRPGGYAPKPPERTGPNHQRHRASIPQPGPVAVPTTTSATRGPKPRPGGYGPKPPERTGPNHQRQRGSIPQPGPVAVLTTTSATRGRVAQPACSAPEPHETIELQAMLWTLNNSTGSRSRRRSNTLDQRLLLLLAKTACVLGRIPRPIRVRR
jgi:hypothetical protein